MRLQTITILTLTLAGFALRLHYLTATHPFFDEYTTVLAARKILREGWPILPSGLFYEHGLLSTYLIAPFTALFINTPQTQWQPAHWGLMLSRWPSLLISTATIPLIFTIGRRAGHYSSLARQDFIIHQLSNTQSKIQNPKSKISLLAAGLFALSPEGMVWGGRARMYALATLLVLLTVYWAYRGAAHPAPAKFRWLALATLLATLLTQFGAMMLVPALVVSMVLTGRLSWSRGAANAKEQGSRGAEDRGSKGAEERGSRGEEESSYASRITHHASRIPVLNNIEGTHHASRVWFLRPTILLEGAALAAVVGFAIFVKRLGRPIGAASLGDPDSSGLLTELLNTITYQTAFHFTWPDTVKFLSRQFGVPHHFWLTIAAIAGLAIAIIFWLIRKQLSITNYQLPITNYQSEHSFTLFLCLIFGLIILEMITLLDPFRRNPRYIVMYLPLFYLIAANSINYQLSIINYQLSKHMPGFFNYYARRSISNLPISILALLTLFTLIGLADLRVALLTPEPAYEEAFAHIQAEWQPGDILLTMNTPAAGLYLGHADGFTVQADADQFLINADTTPVDRWLGAPWLGAITDFNAALNAGPRTWFVIDAIRQPVYFRGDWQAVVNTQMEQVWTKDNAIIYRTRPDQTPLPTHPDILINATLGNSIQLAGYALKIQNPKLALERSEGPKIQNLHLTLLWRPLAPLSTDYTNFLHLRNSDGATVAQRDSQPLDGAYPTSHWQPNETVIDPITLPLPDNLPPGTYTLFTGLYRLDTLKRLPVANDASGENAILLGEVALP